MGIGLGLKSSCGLVLVNSPKRFSFFLCVHEIKTLNKIRTTHGSTSSLIYFKNKNNFLNKWVILKHLILKDRGEYNLIQDLSLHRNKCILLSHARQYTIG